MPYVKIYLDDKHQKQKSKTKQDSNNPTWNESFVLYIFLSFLFESYICLFSNHLRGQDTLHVDVYDEDSVKDEKIGSLKIDLRDLYEKGFYSKLI